MGQIVPSTTPGIPNEDGRHHLGQFGEIDDDTGHTTMQAGDPTLRERYGRFGKFMQITHNSFVLGNRRRRASLGFIRRLVRLDENHLQEEQNLSYLRVHIG